MKVIAWCGFLINFLFSFFTFLFLLPLKTPSQYTSIHIHLTDTCISTNQKEVLWRSRQRTRLLTDRSWVRAPAGPLFFFFIYFWLSFFFFFSFLHLHTFFSSICQLETPLFIPKLWTDPDHACLTQTLLSQACLMHTCQVS